MATTANAADPPVQPLSKRQLKAAKAASENARLRSLEAVVDRANAVQDLLADFPSFQSYARAGPALSLRFATASALPGPTRAWALDLTRRNMRSMYEAVWGWSDAKKLAELSHVGARFLVAHAASGDPVAFAHVRFELPPGEDRPQAYVYDLQLEPSAQRRGLGRFLMLVTELAARRHGLSHVVLTVMTANGAAQGLYRAMGYNEDVTSPGQGAGYDILSKAIAPPAVRRENAAVVANGN